MYLLILTNSFHLIRLNPLIDGYRRKTNVADYETKVPEIVRITNAEKLNSAESELEATLKAKRDYESMRG